MVEELLPHPKYFNASCAFVAVRLMSTTAEPQLIKPRPPTVALILLGSARLLGFLLERAERRGRSLELKLRKAAAEVDEMRRRRSEDARANEKVVSIFATHEQRWIAERKGLRLQIQVLTSELEGLKSKHQELSKKVAEQESAMRAKDEAMEGETKAREELEEKLRLASQMAEELKDKAAREAQEHARELRKHRTALAELVSAQRQLEAEAGRAQRELGEAVEQRAEAVSVVERLSEEVVRLEKDAEQKDKVLSAMLRKSRLDAAERQALAKEVKMARARKKQAELEAERWRGMWEERHRKGPRAAAGSVEAESSRERGGGGFDPAALLLEYFGAENRKQVEPAMSKEESVITTIRCLDQYSGEGNEAEIDIDGIQNLQEWVRLETEKCATILEQRHHAEVEAFTEQMRLKDEKLEAFHWQILSMELETKRLHSHIDRLEESLSQSRDESLRLESQLSDRERELKSLKEEFSFFVQQCQKNSKYFASEVKVTKRKTREKEQEAKAVSNFDRVENNGDPKFMLLESLHSVESICRDTVVNDIITTTPSDSAPPTDHSDEHSVTCVDEFPSEAEKLEKPSWDQAWVITPTVQSPKEEIEEEKEVTIDPVHVQIKNNSLTDAGAASKLTSVRQSFALKHSSWKMDIHALGVSYRIKRLKQQLLVLEKLAAKYIITKDSILQHSNEIEGDNAQHLKGFALVTTLLNKQVKRFQSLEEKTDNLCRRMHENSRGGSRMDSSNGKTKEQTRILESFLEEAFQLQRFTVATGQKLMDIQSRISGSFADNDGLDESAGFNMVQFADVIRTLFKEIHRGLEVRIARIIGDLEGTLACDGILHR